MVTDSDFQRLLNRVVSIEQHLNDLSVAQDRLISLEQVNDLVVTLTADIQSLAERIQGVEDRVQIIENEPLE